LSSITNVITTVFRSRRDASVAAEIGGIRQGMGGIANSIGQTTRMSERLNNQWKAIGTTFRYAIAGAAVFGTAKLVTNLRDLQRQVGLIQALGNTTNGMFPNSQNFGINNLLTQVRSNAVEAVTPINEFNEGLINLFSSVQNVPENQAARMMREISLTAQLAQTDSETASKAVFGMLQTFGMPVNLTNIRRMSRSISELITQVPGGPEAGRQIFTQYPQLAAAYLMGGGTPAQMFGNYQTLLRAGGSPSTGGRGLQYLIQTLANPGAQTNASRAALGSIGINQQFIQQHGVERALAVLLAHVRSLGATAQGGARSISDDQLDALFTDGSASINQMHQLGIGGRGSEFLNTAIPRIHGVRAAVLLATQRDQHSDNLQMVTDLNRQRNAWDGTADAVNNYNKQIDNLTGPQQMQRASIAIQGLQQQALQTIQPGLNLAARGVTGIGAAANRHPHVASAAMLAALGIGAGFGVRRFLRGAGSAVVRANAVHAALTPGGVLGDSPQNPLYVVVVGNLFKESVGGGPTGPGGAKPISWWRKAWNRMPPVIGGIGAGTLGTAALGTAALAAVLASSGAAANVPGMPHGNQTNLAQHLAMSGKIPHSVLVAGARAAGLNPAVTGAKAFGNTDYVAYILNWANTHGVMGGNLNAVRRAGAVGGAGGDGAMLRGRADVGVTIDMPDGRGGRARRTVHVPADLWQGGRTPSSRGKKSARNR
jgi:hypothetical protein